MENAWDVLRMVVHAEPLFDPLTYQRTCPDSGLEPSGLRTGLHHAHDLRPLFLAQPGGRPRCGRVRKPSLPSRSYQLTHLVTADRSASNSAAIAITDRPSTYPRTALARRQSERSFRDVASRSNSRSRSTSRSVRRDGRTA